MKKKIKYDNIFIALSIIFLGTLFLIYSIRLVYFFSIEKKKPKQEKVLSFSQYLIENDSNLTKKSNKYYYYTGKQDNNYVLYSGILFRIVSIKDGNIKLVTDEDITSLVMAYDDVSYEDSYANTWLNDYFSSLLKDKNKYLVNTKTCVDTLNNYEVDKCKKYNEDYLLGLLSIDEYLKSSANNGYLNNGTYFWLSNKDSDSNYWYVYDKGGIANKAKTEVTYHSYGIRPTITLNKDVPFATGKGTKKEPYVIDVNNNKLLINHNVGEYINYGGYKWRIIGYDDNFVKLALADNLKIDDELVLKTYDYNTSLYDNTVIFNYLNKDFYNSLSNKELVLKHTWYNGIYNDENKYDYKAISNSSVEAYVGLLNIGDLYLFDTDNIFLMTRSTKTMQYSIQNNKIFIDLISRELNIRPVIYIDGKVNVKGNGSKNKPLEIVGE